MHEIELSAAGPIAYEDTARCPDVASVETASGWL